MHIEGFYARALKFVQFAYGLTVAASGFRADSGSKSGPKNNLTIARLKLSASCSKLQLCRGFFYKLLTLEVHRAER